MSKETKTFVAPAGTYYSDDFEYINQKLRQHFKLANREIDEVKDKVNELVAIVHKDNTDWPLKKICAYIAGRNDDFEEFGFSAKTIIRYLNEENRKLIDTRKQRSQPSPSLEALRREKGELVQNNVMEQSGDRCPQNVLEDSSIVDLPSEPTYLKKELEEPEQIYDEDDPTYLDYLIQKYDTKIANAKHWIEHYHQEIQIMTKERNRIKEKRAGMTSG